MIKNLKIYLKLTIYSFQLTLVNRFIALLLLFGKIIRILLFLIFLYFLFEGTKGIAGYTNHQIIFFYLSFNLIDTLSQLLFREVYRFRSLVITGNLDFILLKPINPLIRVLLGGTDLLDLVMFFLILAVLIFYGLTNISITPWHWLIFTVLILNGVLISAAFYIFVLSMGVRTTTVDHFVMLYRDFTALMRIPVDLYAQPIRFLLTFIIPLGIMITFPAKGLMNLLSPVTIVISITVAIILLFLSILFWNKSLKLYQSASS